MDLSPRIHCLMRAAMTAGLPAEETTFAQLGTIHIGNLHSHARRVDHALDLLEEARRQLNTLSTPTIELPDDQKRARRNEVRVRHPRYQAWQMIAARDICITLHDYIRSLQSAKTAIQSSATLRRLVNVRSLDVAIVASQEKYPDHLELRNAACHAVDYSAKPSDVKRNSVATAAGGLGMYTFLLSGDDIKFSGNGRLLSLTLNRELVASLDEISAMVLEALPPSAWESLGVL